MLSGTFNIQSDRGFDIGVIDVNFCLRKLNRELMPNFSQYLSGANFTRTFTLNRTLGSTTQLDNTRAIVLNDQTLWNDQRQTMTRPASAPVSGLGNLSKMVDDYKAQENLAKEMRKNLKATVSDLTSQLASINMALNGNKKKKKGTKRQSQHMSGRSYGTEPHYSSSIRIGTRSGYNGQLYLKTKAISNGTSSLSRSTSRNTTTSSNKTKKHKSSQRHHHSDSDSDTSVSSNKSSKKKNTQAIGTCYIDTNGPQKKLTLSFNLPDGILIDSANQSIDIQQQVTLQEQFATMQSVDLQPVQQQQHQQQHFVQQPHVPVTPQVIVTPPQLISQPQINNYLVQPQQYAQPSIMVQPPIEIAHPIQQAQPVQVQNKPVHNLTVDTSRDQPKLQAQHSDDYYDDGNDDDEEISIRQSVFKEAKTSNPRYTDTLLSTVTPNSPRGGARGVYLSDTLATTQGSVNTSDTLRASDDKIGGFSEEELEDEDDEEEDAQYPVNKSNESRHTTSVSKSFDDEFDDYDDESDGSYNEDHNTTVRSTYEDDYDSPNSDEEYMYDDDNRRSFEEDDRI
jgi:hypothetical protein